jgi:two-component system sensor histidine kinase YesM
MSKETLDSLLDKKKGISHGSGVGVKNVHERIQLYYGEEYGLKIESELESGTCVRIWLPIINDEGQEVMKNEENQ